MALPLVALAISWTIGWLLLELIWPARSASSDRVFRAAVAGGLGLFASSLLYSASLLAGIASRPWVVAIDLIALVALGAWAMLARQRPALETAADEAQGAAARSATPPTDWLLGVGLVAALFASANAWLLRCRV